MATASLKPHKFFEKYLDNDLNDLFNYLSDIYDKILNENILNVPENILKKYTQGGAATQLGMEYYNIFTFLHPGIFNLYKALSDATREACEYYDLDFESQQYAIHGWFNLDNATPDNSLGISPLKNSKNFHDHSNGMGAPWFHGYYCVNAEPSSTFYQINGDESNVFENINKNNRAILSETGHPHGRDDWFQEKPRITIAYDISPLNLIRGVRPGKFIPLI